MNRAPCDLRVDENSKKWQNRDAIVPPRVRHSARLSKLTARAGIHRRTVHETECRHKRHRRPLIPGDRARQLWDDAKRFAELTDGFSSLVRVQLPVEWPSRFFLSYWSSHVSYFAPSSSLLRALLTWFRIGVLRDHGSDGDPSVTARSGGVLPPWSRRDLPPVCRGYLQPPGGFQVRLRVLAQHCSCLPL